MTRLTDVADRTVSAIGAQAWLDKPGYKVEHAVSLVLNLLGPASHPVRKLLHGTPLGHPLHPLLTDLPVGSWTAALVLDVADVLTAERNRLGPAAQVAVAVGLTGAAGAAVTGVTDWQYTEGKGGRIGMVHGAVNATVLCLYAISLVQRRRGHPGRGRVLSGIGYALLSGSAYLGGMLVYRHRIGVDHSDAELEPREFLAVMAEADLPDGRPIGVAADGVSVVLVRERGVIHARGAVRAPRWPAGGGVPVPGRYRVPLARVPLRLGDRSCPRRAGHGPHALLPDADPRRPGRGPPATSDTHGTTRSGDRPPARRGRCSPLRSLPRTTVNCTG